MANKVTLEQVERLAMQLSPQEQLRMVAHISQRLSELTVSETVEGHERQDYARRVEAFLKMSDEMAAETIGEVDSAEDIRQIRDERMSRL
jgi:hypothetical protein